MSRNFEFSTAVDRAGGKPSYGVMSPLMMCDELIVAGAVNGGGDVVVLGERFSGGDAALPATRM